MDISKSAPLTRKSPPGFLVNEIRQITDENYQRILADEIIEINTQIKKRAEDGWSSYDSYEHKDIVTKGLKDYYSKNGFTVFSSTAKDDWFTVRW